jgi:hypothetical protein
LIIDGGALAGAQVGEANPNETLKQLIYGYLAGDINSR